MPVAGVKLKSCFEDPLLQVMNFLNEVVLRYPDAISFAPGRPAERYFDVAESLQRIATYVKHRATAAGLAPQAVYDDLGIRLSTCCWRAIRPTSASPVWRGCWD
jgi:hypothetical protein